MGASLSAADQLLYLARSFLDQCSQSIRVQSLFEKVMLRYDVLNKKRRPAIDHCFAKGFLPNGGHPLVLFRWRFGTSNRIPDHCPAGFLNVTVRFSQ